VWDLRKNEPIIKVSDHSNRVSGESHNTGLDLASLSYQEVGAAVLQVRDLFSNVGCVGFYPLADFLLRVKA
jgi:hypothetical protein